jgi:uncharacterized protein (DUF305 family)
VVGIVVAATAAVVGITLAIGALTSGGTPATEEPASEPVTATDFCYVESMIYYGVEANDIADAMQNKPDASSGARELTESLIAAQTARLEDDLRPWYVSWTQYRPLEPSEDGPCAGHGNHSQMPGMPTPVQWDALLAAGGADAERLFAEILIAQNEAMVDFAEQVLAEHPHSRVQDSAAATIDQAEDDIAQLERLLAGLP